MQIKDQAPEPSRLRLDSLLPGFSAVALITALCRGQGLWRQYQFVSYIGEVIHGCHHACTHKTYPEAACCQRFLILTSSVLPCAHPCSHHRGTIPRDGNPDFQNALDSIHCS